jgi:hypothetical protein
LGQRSRRRMRAGAPDAGAPAPAPDPADRLAGPRDTGPPAAPKQPAPASASRSALRDERVRADLEPLEAGERPLAVTIAAVIAGLSGVGNLIAYAAGLKVRGHTQAFGGVAAFSVIMLVAAVGMVRLRYWAVLGFQALLALTILIAGIALIKVSTLLGLVILLAIVGFGGLLFWRLVQALARIQMPQRRA